MADILHRIKTAAPLEKVQAAVTTEEGLKSWWTEDTKAKPEPGFVNVFRFHNGAVEFHFRIDDISDKHVEWTCLRKDRVPEEWVDTRVTFDLEPSEDGGTVIRFAHDNWRSVDGDYAMCNTTWGDLMHRLRDYSEGKAVKPHFER